MVIILPPNSTTKNHARLLGKVRARRFNRGGIVCYYCLKPFSAGDMVICQHGGLRDVKKAKYCHQKCRERATYDLPPTPEELSEDNG